MVAYNLTSIISRMEDNNDSTDNPGQGDLFEPKQRDLFDNTDTSFVYSSDAPRYDTSNSGYQL